MKKLLQIDVNRKKKAAPLRKRKSYGISGQIFGLMASIDSG